MPDKIDFTNIRSNGITFESLMPRVVNGVTIPLIEIGYNGKFIGTLAQYTKNAPHAKESILPGQWFCLMTSSNAKLDAMLNNIEPAGRELDELKRLVTYFVNRYMK